jgi:hypothetical protein
MSVPNPRIQISQYDLNEITLIFQPIIKKCSRYGEYKLRKEFYPHKKSLDKLNYNCKQCDAEYYQTNKKPLTPEQKERHRIASLKYFRNNKEKYKDYHKRPERKEYNKLYRERNKEKLKEQARQRYYNNKKNVEWLEKKRAKGREFSKQYAKKYPDKVRETDNRCKHNRRKKDIGFRIKTNLRNRLVKVLKNVNKSASTIKLLGCSIEYLKEHLQNQFTDGMSWKNYGSGKGKWSIDHKIACINFDLRKEEEQRKCFNWKNLQPLWVEENSRKGGKLEYSKS